MINLPDIMFKSPQYALSFFQV